MCAGVFIAADDQTVVVTVLPNIMLDMEVQVNQLDRASWTITGYLLGYVAAMPLIGRLSDVWGHRRLFIVSTALFMAGSAGVALAPNLTWLIALRVFQAVGAGALVPISIAIVGDLFPPGRRGLPMGMVGASAEAGGVIGPLWGGLTVRFSEVLNQAASPFISLDLDWQWVFWINIPLGAAVLLAVILLLKPSPRYRARVDYLGGGLIAVSLATLTLGLARVEAPGPLMVGYLLASGTSLVLFIVRQRVAVEPLLPTSMFRSWTFRAANGTHLLVGGALIIGMVTIPLMADTVLGQQPLEGGLRLMRLTAAIPVGSITRRNRVPAHGLPRANRRRSGARRGGFPLHELVGPGDCRPGHDGPPGGSRTGIRSRNCPDSPCRDKPRRSGGPGGRGGPDNSDAYGGYDAWAGYLDRVGNGPVPGPGGRFPATPAATARDDRAAATRRGTYPVQRFFLGCDGCMRDRNTPRSRNVLAPPPPGTVIRGVAGPASARPGWGTQHGIPARRVARGGGAFYLSHSVSLCLTCGERVVHMAVSTVPGR